MKALASVIGAIFALCGSTASATLVTVDFTGTIVSVDSGLGSAVVNGETISGSFTYNSATLASSGGSTGAEFWGLQGVSIQIGALSESATGSHSIFTSHSGTMDVFQILADSTLNASTVFSGGKLNSLSANDFILNDAAPFGSLFSDASHLPGSLPGVSMANSGSSFIQLGFGVPGTGSDLFLQASLDGITTVGNHSVPEPDSFALLLIGVAGIVFGTVKRNRDNVCSTATAEGQLAS